MILTLFSYHICPVPPELGFNEMIISTFNKLYMIYILDYYVIL